MVAVFHRVSADIAPEFIENFPIQFDFKGMLKKICDDVGVAITIIGSSYNIEGQWNTVGKAHNMLVSTLAVYGSTNIVRQEQEGVLSQGSRPFSALVEAAEAISRGVELQEQVQKEMMGMDRISDHKFSSFQPDSVKQTSISDVNSIIKQDMSFHESHSSDNKSNSDIDMPSDSECYDSIFYERQRIDVNKPLNNDITENKSNTEWMHESKRALTVPSEVKQGLRKGAKLMKTEIGKSEQNRTMVKDDNTDITEIHIENEVEAEPETKSKKKIFPCDDCDFVGKTRHATADHKNRTHKAEASECDICKKIFPNQRYMKRHRSLHNKTLHSCDVCGKKYKVLKALREHQKRHDETYVKPEFKCDQCTKSFCSTYVLECHIKSEHLGIKKSFLCQTCGKSFSTKHTLQEHVNVHVGIRPYECTECGKSFHYESALRDHLNIHQGTKKFICTYKDCNKAFRQRSALKMHEKIHKDTKDFTCPECDREFTQKQALQRHMRAHKGLKPFRCRLCHRKFGEASVIRRHLILVHKIAKDPSKWREDIEQIDPEENNTTNSETNGQLGHRVDLDQTVNNHQINQFQYVVEPAPVKNVRLPPVSALQTYRPIESFTHQLENDVNISSSQELSSNHTNQISYAVPTHHDYIHTGPVPASYNYTPTPLEYSLNSDGKNTTHPDNGSHHLVPQYEVEHHEIQPGNIQNDKTTVQFLHIEPLSKSNSDQMSCATLEHVKLPVTHNATKENAEGRGQENVETLENVNMTQFYSYYTSLGGQYMNVGHL